MELLYASIGYLLLSFSCTFKSSLSKEQEKIIKNKKNYIEYTNIIAPEFDLQTVVPLTICSNCDVISHALDHFEKTRCSCGGRFRHFGSGVFLNACVYVSKLKFVPYL